MATATARGNAFGRRTKPRRTFQEYHCKNLLGLLSGHGSARIDRNDIIELVDLVAVNREEPIDRIRNEIRASNPKWMTWAIDDDSIHASLDFAMRLWLFIRPELNDGTRTLSQVVAEQLPDRAPPPNPPGHLSHDFCAKSLTRKGGLKIEWTSYLSDHLTLLYPGDFLSETERTLSLLFPPANFETSKRTRRIGEKDPVDIEAAIESAVASDEMLDLSNYPYWQERLREVQKAYDHARPKTLTQWWFDRRHRFEWATFWTAVVVFFLTLIFGLIAAITGIMQVYAAFKALQ